MGLPFIDVRFSPKSGHSAARLGYLAVDAKKPHIRASFPTKEYGMASRQIKMPVKDDSESDMEEAFSQRKRPERSRFLLQVDRQTKGSYTWSDEQN